MDEQNRKYRNQDVRRVEEGDWPHLYGGRHCMTSPSYPLSYPLCFYSTELRKEQQYAGREDGNGRDGGIGV